MSPDEFFHGSGSDHLRPSRLRQFPQFFYGFFCVIAVRLLNADEDDTLLYII